MLFFFFLFFLRTLHIYRVSFFFLIIHGIAGRTQAFHRRLASEISLWKSSPTRSAACSSTPKPSPPLARSLAKSSASALPRTTTQPSFPSARAAGQPRRCRRERAARRTGGAPRSLERLPRPVMTRRDGKKKGGDGGGGGGSGVAVASLGQKPSFSSSAARRRSSWDRDSSGSSFLSASRRASCADQWLKEWRSREK